MFGYDFLPPLGEIIPNLTCTYMFQTRWVETTKWIWNQVVQIVVLATGSLHSQYINWKIGVSMAEISLGLQLTTVLNCLTELKIIQVFFF